MQKLEGFVKNIILEAIQMIQYMPNETVQLIDSF